MSKIIQPDFQSDLRHGGFDSQVGSNSFGINVKPIGKGLSDLGNAMVAVAVAGKKKKNRAEEIAKGLADDKWVSEQYAAYTKSASDFSNDENNYSSPEFVQQFEEFSLSQISELEQTAPSPEAAQRFREKAGAKHSSHYDQAGRQTAKTQLTNTITAFGEEAQAISYEYRNNPDNEVGLDNLETGRNSVITDIEERFGKIDRKLTNELIANTNLHFIEETMIRNPSYAEDLLNKDKNIPAAKRQDLLKEINRNKDAVNLLDLDTFNRDRNLATTNAAMGQSYEKLPIEEYQLYHDADKAAVLKRSDDMQIDAYQMANNFVSETEYLNPAAQQEKFDTLVESAKSPEEREAISRIVAPAVEKNIRFIEKDPAGWLRHTNPAIKRIDEEISRASDDQAVVLRKERSDLVMQYQGYAPEGAPDADHYLNKPSNQRNLLSVAEANQLANEINRESPQQALTRIQEILAAYPDEEHRWIVFNDLSGIGKEKLRQEYQLAFQNSEAWWIDTYVASLQGADAAEKLSESKRTELVGMISGHPTWVAFQTSIIGDNFQRANEIQGYKTGIEAYSRALMLRGTPMKEAVEKATEMLISEQLGFTEINGEPMAVLRKRADGTEREQEEIDDIGRRLTYSLQFVDPREIDQTNFTGLEGLGPDEQRIERLQVLRDAITSQGFWQMMPDGQSVTLYYEDDNGQIFQVIGRDKTPFEIALDDLPSFTRTVPRRGGTRTWNLKPSKTYNLQQKNRNGIRTHFPTDNEFIR